MSTIFEKASQMKLRFKTTLGQITTEDLWDLPLTSKSRNPSLDGLYKQISKDAKADVEESYVLKSSTTNEVAKLQLNILTHIMDIKMAEAEEAKARVAKEAKRQQILGLIADKENQELAGASKDDLLKMLTEL